MVLKKENIQRLTRACGSVNDAVVAAIQRITVSVHSLN